MGLLEVLLNALPETIGGVVAAAILALIGFLLARLRKRGHSEYKGIGEQNAASTGVPQERSNALEQLAFEQQETAQGEAIVARATPWKVYHNLPQPTYSAFVGMKSELAIIRRLLGPSSRHFLVTVDGVGGVGKSALALEVAYRYVRQCDRLPEEERFDAIVWTSAKTSLLTANGIIARPQAARTLENIFTTVSVVLQREDITRAYPEQRDELVRRALSQQRTLLIVDNLETVDDERVNAFLRELPAPTKAIVTTRHRLDVAYPIRLKGMPKDEAELLIVHECKEQDTAINKEEILRLYRRTGGVPLAIVWCVARMAYGFDVPEVLRQLGEPGGDIVRFCFRETVEPIRGTDTHQLLMALALFTTSASRESLGYVAGSGADVISRDEALARLERLSLVSKQWDRFTMLPVTRIFVEHELRKEISFLNEARNRWVEWAIQFVEQSSPLGSVDDSSHAVVQQDYENILAAIDWCHADERWSALAELAAHMCLYLFRQGLWQVLLEVAERGMVACEKIKDHEKQAWLNLYATLVHIYRGELDQAEFLMGETELILQRLDDVPQELKESYLYRQSILAHRRNGVVVKDLLESRLSLARMVGDEWRVVSTLSHLAEWALDNRLLKECDDYLEDALEVAEASGSNNLIARVLTGMSKLDRERGDLAHARTVCERAGKIAPRTQSTTVAHLALETARVQRELGNADEARFHARTALDIFARFGIQREISECTALIDSISDQSE